MFVIIQYIKYQAIRGKRQVCFVLCLDGEQIVEMTNSRRRNRYFFLYILENYQSTIRIDIRHNIRSLKDWRILRLVAARREKHKRENYCQN